MLICAVRRCRQTEKQRHRARSIKRYVPLFPPFSPTAPGEVNKALCPPFPSPMSPFSLPFPQRHRAKSIKRYVPLFPPPTAPGEVNKALCPPFPSAYVPLFPPRFLEDEAGRERVLGFRGWRPCDGKPLKDRNLLRVGIESLIYNFVLRVRGWANGQGLATMRPLVDGKSAACPAAGIPRFIGMPCHVGADGDPQGRLSTGIRSLH